MSLVSHTAANATGAIFSGLETVYWEENIWGQADFFMMDVSRASAIAAIFSGATAGRVGVSRLVRASKAYETGRPSHKKGEVWANAEKRRW